MELLSKNQYVEKALCGLTTKDVRRVAYDFATQSKSSTVLVMKAK